MKNNWQKGKITLDLLKREGKRPSLLLHCCCGPCSTFPIELLNDYFDITLYFNNSNIYPEEEYNHRLSEFKRYVSIFNDEHNSNIQIIVEPYDNENYTKLLSIRANDKEKGPRCRLCYATRLKQAFEYAKDHNIEYVSTVMSMSRQKDEQAINKIGLVLQSCYDNEIKFLVHNFKKKGGQERRDYLVEKYNIYDQNYCGCIYSLKEK